MNWLNYFSVRRIGFMIVLEYLRNFFAQVFPEEKLIMEILQFKRQNFSFQLCSNVALFMATLSSKLTVSSGNTNGAMMFFYQSNLIKCVSDPPPKYLDNLITRKNELKDSIETVRDELNLKQDQFTFDDEVEKVIEVSNSCMELSFVFDAMRDRFKDTFLIIFFANGNLLCTAPALIFVKNR